MYAEKDAEMNEKKMSLLNVIWILSKKPFLSADGFFFLCISLSILAYSKSSYLSVLKFTVEQCYIITYDVIFAHLLSLHC